jgi:hypothetical protein
MASDRSTKDKEMAAHLKRQGIYHGMRPHSSNADPMSYLKGNLTGTARWRRYMEYLRQGKKSRKNDTQRRKEWE